jgi:hypothetical protein
MLSSRTDARTTVWQGCADRFNACVEEVQQVVVEATAATLIADVEETHGLLVETQLHQIPLPDIGDDIAVRHHNVPAALLQVSRLRMLICCSPAAT